MNNQNTNSSPPLNPAEKEVLAAFQAGAEAVSPVAGEMSLQEAMEKMSKNALEKAEISGDFLRKLFLGHYDEKADYRGTCIVGAVISEVLNMEFCETKFPVRFFGCEFAEQIKMQQLKCPELYFDGCTLEEGMYAAYAKVGGNVSLAREFAAEGSVSLSGADIGGQFSCRGGHFHNQVGDALDAQGIKVVQDVFLDVFKDNDKNQINFTAKGRVTLAGADIGGQFVCEDGRFLNPGVALVAQNIKVTQGVFLNGEFRAKGRVTLVSAEISGRLNCKGHFLGGMLLGGAKIGGQFSCSGGHFGKDAEGGALHAQNIQAGDVFLDSGFAADGRVNLAGADIHGQLDCEDGRFLGGMLLGGAKIGGQFSCSGGHFGKDAEGGALHAQNIQAGDVFLDSGFAADGRVNLAGADIHGQLDCEDGRFLGGMLLGGAKIGGQFLCSGGHFLNAGVAIFALNIKVTQDVFLAHGFTAKGVVRLSGADIGGQLDCRCGRFQSPMKGAAAFIAKDIKVAEDVLLGDEELTAEGEEKLEDEKRKKLPAEIREKVEAEIRENLPAKVQEDHALEVLKKSSPEIRAMLEVEVRKNLEAKGSGKPVAEDVQKKVVVDVLVGHAAEDFKNLPAKDREKLQANCKKELEDEGYKKPLGELQKALGEENWEEFLAECRKKLSDECWNKFSADGVNLAGANIQGDLVLKKCQCLARLTLAGADVKGEFKDVFTAYRGGVDESDGIGIELDINGFRYGRLDVHGVEESKDDRLKWVGHMSKGDNFYPQPYEQLMKVYREMGHINWVRKVGFELEKKRGKNFDSLRWKAWYGVLRLVLGYGYKPLKIVGWWSLLLAASIWLFGSASPCTSPAQVDQMNQLEADAGRAWWKWPQHCMATSPPGSGHPRFRPVFYAVEVVIPALPLGQTGYWYPEKTWVARTQGGLTIAGSVLLAILAAYGISILPGGGRGDR